MKLNKIIVAENLSHRFTNGRFGIKDITLSIHEGEFVVIAGPNGSGKTTFIRHLNGLARPTGGRVLLDGIDIAQNVIRARRLVGMVFQNPDSQIVGETVYDDVAFGPENLSLDRAEIEKRVNESLQSVGLSHLAEERPHLLSGGEKRRLAIAGVLAMRPRVIVFDEPFSNLDYPGVRQVLQQIVSLHQSGHTILVTTHDLEKVIAHSNRVILLSEGRVARDGAPDTVIKESEAFGVREPCASRLGLEVGSWLN